MNKRIDHGTAIHGGKTVPTNLRTWIATTDGECPECGSHSLIKKVDSEVIIGCLVCGWKEIDSIDQSIQKAFDNLKKTMERISTN